MKKVKKYSFKKDGFIIVNKAISNELALFIYNYFLIKRQVAETFFKTNHISSESGEWGTWRDLQVPNTYSHYADIAMETLLLKLHSLMEKNTKLKLNPNYSYARIYKKGDILKRHKDRFSCEISTTLFLGGDKWPIYLETANRKELMINLNQGDMLIYKGNILDHWREPFKGNNCAQVFLHYNNADTKGAADNIYDKRIHVGLPSNFSNNSHIFTKKNG
jgi:hypothetical protein